MHHIEPDPEISSPISSEASGGIAAGSQIRAQQHGAWRRGFDEVRGHHEDRCGEISEQPPADPTQADPRIVALVRAASNDEALALGLFECAFETIFGRGRFDEALVGEDRARLSNVELTAELVEEVTLKVVWRDLLTLRQIRSHPFEDVSGHELMGLGPLAHPTGKTSRSGASLSEVHSDDPAHGIHRETLPDATTDASPEVRWVGVFVTP